MTKFSKSLGWLGALAVVVGVCAGCPAKEGSGLPTAHLKGAVTLNGGPIPADADASIVFYPAEVGDARAASAIIKDGKYDVADAPIGKGRAVISITQPTGEVVEEAGRKSIQFKSLVPKPLWDGQEIHVDGDNVNLNFDIK